MHCKKWKSYQKFWHRFFICFILIDTINSNCSNIKSIDFKKKNIEDQSSPLSLLWTLHWISNTNKISIKILIPLSIKCGTRTGGEIEDATLNNCIHWIYWNCWLPDCNYFVIHVWNMATSSHVVRRFIDHNYSTMLQQSTYYFHMNYDNAFEVRYY